MKSAIPVVYYHSVADHSTARSNDRLSISRSVFEWQIRRLAARGYKTIDLEQLHQFVSGSRKSTGKEIVLTFDDGFLDNYVFVFPLARKLGFKFTIYVNPEFVDPCESPRPTWEDVESGNIGEDELDWWGYMSWAEMRMMQESGLVDIQSHTMSHTWHFCGSKVIDYHHPGCSYHWLAWNKDPESKFRWMSKNDSHSFLHGNAIYENGRSIAVRKYIPDHRLDECLAKIVKRYGNGTFFENPKWRNILDDERLNFLKKYGDQGRMETDSEYNERIYYEVVESRRQIEESLGKPVRFLCWPGGGETEFARKLALDNGYLSTTKGVTRNQPGVGDPSHVHRIASLYKAGLPKWVNNQLFDGQIDRATGVLTIRGILTDLLARAARLGRGR